jgi:hypothetical protein
MARLSFERDYVGVAECVGVDPLVDSDTTRESGQEVPKVRLVDLTAVECAEQRRRARHGQRQLRDYLCQWVVVSRRTAVTVRDKDHGTNAVYTSAPAKVGTDRHWRLPGAGDQPASDRSA